MLAIRSSRCHNPYLLHWPPQWLLEVHPVVGAIAAATAAVATTAIAAATTSVAAATPLTTVTHIIALPRVQRMRDGEWSPLVVNNPCQRQCSGTPPHQSGEKLRQRLVLRQPTPFPVIQSEICLCVMILECCVYLFRPFSGLCGRTSWLHTMVRGRSPGMRDSQVASAN